MPLVQNMDGRLFSYVNGKENCMNEREIREANAFLNACGAAENEGVLFPTGKGTKSGIKKTFRAVRQEVKEQFNPSRTVDARLVITGNGTPFMELRQGDRKRYVRADIHIETQGGCWSSSVWLCMLVGQYYHTKVVMALDEMMKRLPNVHLNTERMNVLYYPFIADYPYPFVRHEIEWGIVANFAEGERREDGYQAGHHFGIEKSCIRKMRFINGMTDDKFSLAEEQRKYLDIFRWVEELPREERCNWRRLYAQDAGKELFTLLGMNNLVSSCNYRFREKEWDEPVTEMTFRGEQKYYGYDLSVFPNYEHEQFGFDTVLHSSEEAKVVYDKMFRQVFRDWIEQNGLGCFVLK